VRAAAAQGDTRIRGVAHLRLKESDRIAAPVAELRKAGVAAEECDDGLLIHGQGEAFPLRGKTLELSAWGDHRMAMSLALLECRGADLRLDDPSAVGKSFPRFWELWNRVRA
jgi:3-phosphoshikimate 1-carboxyvinyltransferase